LIEKSIYGLAGRCINNDDFVAVQHEKVVLVVKLMMNAAFRPTVVVEIGQVPGGKRKELIGVCPRRHEWTCAVDGKSLEI